MSTPLLDYGTNRETVKTCMRACRDALVVPVLEGRDASLHYVNGLLQTEGLHPRALKIIDQENIPRDLYAESDTWGEIHVPDLRVHFKRFKTRLIATAVTTPKGDYHSPIVNLHLLIQRGFITVMSLSGWVKFSPGISPNGAERLLKERLEKVNATIETGASSIWAPLDMAYTREQTAQWQFVPPVNQLQVVDAIGFKPTANSRRARAVYKS
jgi:hypothetical protein